MPVVRRSGLRTLALLLVATMLTLAASVLVPAWARTNVGVHARPRSRGRRRSHARRRTDGAGFVSPSSRQTLKVTVRDPSGAPSRGPRCSSSRPTPPRSRPARSTRPIRAGHLRSRAHRRRRRRCDHLRRWSGGRLPRRWLPVGAVGGATFAITVNADGTKPSACAQDARCRLERELLSSDERTRRGAASTAILRPHPARRSSRRARPPRPSTSVQPRSCSGSTRVAAQYATRFVLLDAADIASAPKIVEARYWRSSSCREVPGHATLARGHEPNRGRDQRLLEDSVARAPSVRTGPTAAPTAGGGPGEKVRRRLLWRGGQLPRSRRQQRPQLLREPAQDPGVREDRRRGQARPADVRGPSALCSPPRSSPAAPRSSST